MYVSNAQLIHSFILNTWGIVCKLPERGAFKDMVNPLGSQRFSSFSVVGVLLSE